MVWSLWRHRQWIVTSSAESVKRASETRGWCVKILVLASFLDSLCRVRNKIMYVLLWQTVYALTRVLFWCLFPSLLRNSGNKHQNNPLVSAETIRHSSTYIILYKLVLGSHLVKSRSSLTFISAVESSWNPTQSMMTSSNGNIFRVTGHLCGEFTGLRWIPRTKASDAELWCFLRCVPN